MKVIVSDAESRKGFDIVNLIQRLYAFPVVLAAGKDFGWKLKLIYNQEVHPLRSSSFGLFEQDLTHILETHSETDLIYLPVSEKATRHFYTYISRHPDTRLKYLLPQSEAFECTGDKYRFQAFCQDAGLPVPLSYEKENLPGIESDFRPLIVKPRKGEGSVGIIYIDHPEQLNRLDDLDFSKYVIQEKIPDGHKVEGAFFLCKAGEVVSAYSHKRIRTFPEIGGVTVFSVCEYNKDIIDIGSTLLQQLNWDGVAMIEFLFDQPSGKWKMIELNPRLWGSILLSGYNQSEMLRNYVHLSLGKAIQKSPLQIGTFIRWLFPFEFINFFKGKLSFGEFFNLKGLPTCHINFTYSTIWRSSSYIIYFLFNTSSIKRFFKKLSN